jgi:transposase
MEKETKPRRHFTDKEIADVFTRYEQSGKSKREFCDLEGIHYSTFGNWFRKKKKKKKRATSRNRPVNPVLQM